MVDAGEAVSRTLKREFGEEAMNTLEATEAEKKQIEKQINQLFEGGTKVGGLDSSQQDGLIPILS